MTRRAVLDDSDARRRDLAAIHVAKKSLGWDDDTYRDVMATVTGRRSSGELDHASRKRWMAHLQACLRQIGKPARASAPRRQPWSPALKRLWALWQQLADAGLVRDRTRAGLQAWATRQVQVDRLEWMNPHQTAAVIDAAKGWLDRKQER